MNIQPIFSTKPTLEEMLPDLKAQYQQQFGEDTARFVIFFATSTLNSSLVGEGIKSIFPEADVAGCTTAGELVSGHMLKNSIVAMVFDQEAVENAAVGVVENLKEGVSVDSTFASFEEKFGALKDADLKRTVGIVMIDGLSGAEEKVMEKIGDRTNITFVGGAAGDDAKFKTTYVFANGKTYTDAAVLVLLKLKNEFEVVKTQSFRDSGKSLIATKVDEANREVIEFNGKPAAMEYAEKLDTSTEVVAREFMSHPVGLMIGAEPYVRSPQQVVGDKIKFYCNVKEGANLSVLDATDIVEETESVLTRKVAELGHVPAMLNFHCILRTLELEKKNQTEAYGKIFSNIPMVGFSTYGEEYIGHINQTSTMLFFK